LAERFAKRIIEMFQDFVDVLFGILHFLGGCMQAGVTELME
jgi:hypothetical protein